MGEEDIHHLLFRNQNIGIIEKHHAVIMFNPSPYRTVQEYIERITRQTSKSQPQHTATIHNILEYTFVLQVSFLSELPSNYASSVVDLNISRYFVENKQDTHNLHYTSIIRDVLQMLLYTNNNSSSCPSTDTLKKSLQQIAFRSPAGWILLGKENLVHFEYKLYDFNPSSQDFELVIQLSPSSSTTGSNYRLVLNFTQEIFWPNGFKIYPDPCFKTKENCIESGMGFLLNSFQISLNIDNQLAFKLNISWFILARTNSINENIINWFYLCVMKIHKMFILIVEQHILCFTFQFWTRSKYFVARLSS